jgi:hypothetical protein
MPRRGSRLVGQVADLIRAHEISHAERLELFEALIGDANSGKLTHVSDPLLVRDAAPSRTTPHHAAKRVCANCGETVEAEVLNMRCYVGTGVAACKACIDAALVARYGPRRRASFLDGAYA